jgi:ATP-dependent RNA helicase RhlB
MGPALGAFEDHLSDVYFSDLPLPHPVRAGIAGCGFVRATPVQAVTLPLLLAGKDVAAQAQTGTGKTAAFLITIFTRLARDPRPPRSADPPRALVVAPTRELAVQIRDDATALGHFVNPRIVTVFGGIDYGKQRDQLRAGCDLLIGTPGRLLDYEQQRATSFGTVESLVIDEADRLFDMGFIPDLRRILRRCPPPHRRHTMLFSATLSVRVLELAWEHMNNAQRIEIRPHQLTADRVTQRLYHVGAREKIPLLLGLLGKEGVERTLLFVNTKRFAERVVAALERHGHHVAALTGDLPQARRLKILTDFRTGKLPLLVATDVASRGLHIEGVTHVINVDLPQDPEDYVHRIGRTARAGASGMAISLADENYVFSLAAIERLIGMKIPTEFPAEDLFVWGSPPSRMPTRGGTQSGGPRHLGPTEEEDEDRAPAPAPQRPEAPAPGAEGPSPPVSVAAAEDGDAPDFWTREAFGLEAPEGGFVSLPALLSPGRKRRRRRRKAAATGSTSGSPGSA